MGGEEAALRRDALGVEAQPEERDPEGQAGREDAQEVGHLSGSGSERERCGSTGSEGGGGVAPPGGVVARRGITRAPSASHPHPSLTAAPRLYRQDRVERYVDCRDDDHGAARAREALDLVGRLDLRLLELEREQVHAGHGHAWPSPARGHAPRPLAAAVAATLSAGPGSLPQKREVLAAFAGYSRSRPAGHPL